MSSSESILDEIEFTWKIPYFSTNCHYPGDAIESPLLSVGNPRHSIWMLKLYPQGMLECYQNNVTTELIRMEGSMKGKVVSRISIVTSDGNTMQSFVETNVRSFLWEGVVAYNQTLVQEKDLDEFYLPNDTLTLQCKLTLFGDPLDCVNYTELSENIGRLLESGDCSDIVLCTGDREFLVHRTILAQRAPKFFREFGLSDNPKVQRVEVSDISTPVLEMLLLYLYRGNISPLFINDNLELWNNWQKIQELSEVAGRFKLVELTGEVTSLSPPTTITTHINSIRRTINWIMKPKHGMDGVVKIINFGPLRVLARCQLHSKVLKSKGWIYTYFVVDVGFRCLSTMDENIHLVCRMTIGDGQNDCGSCCEQPLSFSKASPEQYMPKFECSLPDADLTLKLFLKISYGKETHSVEGVDASSLDDPSVFGMSLLRDNLTSLFEENQTKNGGDVTLVCNDKTIRGDRAVLSARSPVFAVMLANDVIENSNRVDILDTDFATTLRLVRFMYSGSVSKQSFEEDAKLYTAADKYQITSLFRKCSGFMISDLILNNACDILTLAFMHNDESLMATVKNYVRINLEAIKETNKWKLFCNTNPDLAVLVKEDIAY